MAGLMQRPGAQQAPQQQATPQEPVQQESAGLEGSEPASPEEQQAYENAVNAIGQIIYSNDKTHEGIMQLLKSEPGVAGLVKATTMLIAELDKKLNLPETVIMELPVDVVDRLIELGQQAGIFQLSEREMLETAQLAVFETMKMYGMDASDLQQMAQSISEKDAEQLYEVYNQMGGFA